jgi:hypothetical protein
VDHLGEKRTSEYVRNMSALPPKADMVRHDRDVRYVPKADITHLLDYLVGAGKHGRRNCEAQFLCGFKIDRQLVLGRRLHWKVTRLLALENTIDIASRLPELVNVVRPIRDQAAGSDEKRVKLDRR